MQQSLVLPGLGAMCALLRALNGDQANLHARDAADSEAQETAQMASGYP